MKRSVALAPIVGLARKCPRNVGSKVESGLYRILGTYHIGSEFIVRTGSTLLPDAMGAMGELMSNDESP